MTAIRWEAAGATDVGRVRRGNEDAFLVDAARGVFVVADGMGGHAAGEVASALSVETVGRLLVEAVEGRAGPEPPLPDVLGSAFQATWEAIRQCCRDDISKSGMGTTLTAAVIHPGGTCWIGHIGDSRAYRFRDGRLEQLTRDHTWVQREVDAGRLAAEAAERHPLSHILSRVLSADLPPEPDVMSLDLQPGDLLLLSSDGMHGLVSDPEIQAVAARGLPLPALLDALIDEANRRGGRDNITAVAARILPTA
jgi:PPM family protein phosphatase